MLGTHQPTYSWCTRGAVDRHKLLRRAVAAEFHRARVSSALSVCAVDSTLQEKQPMLQRLHTIAIRPELGILLILEAMTITLVIIIGHQKKSQPGKYDDLHVSKPNQTAVHAKAAASIIHHEHDRYERLWVLYGYNIPGCRAAQCKHLHAYTQRLRQSEV